MAKIEFYTTPDGVIYYIDNNGEIKKLTRFNREVINCVLEFIQRHFPHTYTCLQRLYPLKNKSAASRLLQDYQITERFIRCNFGEYDLLSKDYENGIFHFEMVKCPLRGGFCPYENIICYPKGLPGIKLSKLEKDVASLYLEGNTFKDIALYLEKKPNTVKTILNRIKKKLNLKNCRSIIKEVRLKNIL